MTYLGALVEEKGVDLLIEAMRDVPDACLVAAGDGPDRAFLEERAHSLLSTRSSFVGPLEEPRAALWASDLLALPSRGGDSMPAVLIEAGLCGLPCVSTPVGAIPDVIDDGRTGAIVPIGDVPALAAALRELCRSPVLRRERGTAARRRCVENFTVEAIVPKWLDVLEQTLRRHVRTARSSGRLPGRA